MLRALRPNNNNSNTSVVRIIDLSEREKKALAILVKPANIKKFLLWENFGLYPISLVGKEEHNDVAVCILCRDINKLKSDTMPHTCWEIKYKSSTSKLQDHLQSCHRDQYE